VFLFGRRIPEGIILMSTFEELILIGMFCFVILENEVNSCYCFIAGKHLFTLLSNTSVSRIFGRERCKKK